MTKIKRVLIPTDFTIRSLRIVIDYLSEATDDQVELVLAHGQAFSDSITELLGFSNDYYVEQTCHQDFLTACQIIKSRFEGKVIDFYSDTLNSKNDSYIRNYLRGNKIDEVILPHDFSFSKLFDRSFCIVNPLKKSCQKLGIPIMEYQTVETFRDEKTGMDSIDSIFFRKELKNAAY